MKLTSRLAPRSGAARWVRQWPKEQPDCFGPRRISGYIDHSNPPLICTDTSTPIEFDFKYDGDLQGVQVTR